MLKIRLQNFKSKYFFKDFDKTGRVGDIAGERLERKTQVGFQPTGFCLVLVHYPCYGITCPCINILVSGIQSTK